MTTEMRIQVLFIALFGLNLCLSWLAALSKNMKWYRLPGMSLFLGLPLATVFFNQPKFELDYFWWRIAGVIAITLGILLIAWAKRSSGQVWLFISAEQEEICRRGPYQFVRQPVYLGVIFVFVGWWWVWAAVYSFYFGMFILMLIWLNACLEEKFILAKKFGEKFEQYRNATGMFWVK